MSINRICFCKRTHSLQVTTCPCGRQPTRFKVRVQRDGRWLTRICDTLEDARDTEHAFRVRKQAPPPLPKCQPKQSPSVTLAQVWALYLPALSDRNTSWTDDLSRWTHHLESKLGTLPLDQITPLVVEDLLAGLTPSDSKRTPRLSPATRHRVFSLLRRLLNWAIKRRLWAGPNPCLALEGVGRYDNTRHRYLTDTEQARLLAALDREENPRVELVLRWLWATGRRRGESLHLTWSDVDLQAGTVTFRRTKSGKVQRVPVNSQAMEVLRRASGMRISNLVFPCESGRYFYSLNRGWQRVRRRAGLVDFHLHDLRANFASRLASSGKADIVSVSKLLGHAGIDITVKRYAALFDQRLRDVAECMG